MFVFVIAVYLDRKALSSTNANKIMKLFDFSKILRINGDNCHIFLLFILVFSLPRPHRFRRGQGESPFPIHSYLYVCGQLTLIGTSPNSLLLRGADQVLTAVRMGNIDDGLCPLPSGQTGQPCHAIFRDHVRRLGSGGGDHVTLSELGQDVGVAHAPPYPPGWRPSPGRPGRSWISGRR